MSEITDEDVYRAAFKKTEEELDRLRAENARLAGDVGSLAVKLGKEHTELEKWKEGCERNADLYKDAVRAQDNYRLDLKGHKSALEKAKKALVSCQSVIPTTSQAMCYNITRTKISEALTAINEVLK